MWTSEAYPLPPLLARAIKPASKTIRGRVGVPKNTLRHPGKAKLATQPQAPAPCDLTRTSTPHRPESPPAPASDLPRCHSASGEHELLAPSSASSRACLKGNSKATPPGFSWDSSRRGPHRGTTPLPIGIWLAAVPPKGSSAPCLVLPRWSFKFVVAALRP